MLLKHCGCFDYFENFLAKAKEVSKHWHHGIEDFAIDATVVLSHMPFRCHHQSIIIVHYQQHGGE
jgi:hypothetical protein